MGRRDKERWGNYTTMAEEIESKKVPFDVLLDRTRFREAGKLRAVGTEVKEENGESVALFRSVPTPDVQFQVNGGARATFAAHAMNVLPEIRKHLESILRIEANGNSDPDVMADALAKIDTIATVAYTKLMSVPQP